MASIYHVACEGWDGCDLVSLARRFRWSKKTAAAIATKWPDLGDTEYNMDRLREYYDTEGRLIHCHATLDEARDYAAEWCGSAAAILAIDASAYAVGTGDEYPHPVIRGKVSARHVARVEG